MKLGKMVYGLSQAAYVFHKKVREVLYSLGFESTLFDSCLFFQFVQPGGSDYTRDLVVIAVYVDNFNIIGEREEDVAYYDAEVAKAIDTRVEDPHVILGVVLVETAHSVQLNMRFQIEAVLERYGMLDANVKTTPLPASLVLKPASTDLQTAESKQYPYPEVVGSVMWIVRCTLVSAKFACNSLYAHMTKWDSTHVAGAQHMLKHLKYVKSEGLVFRKRPTIDKLSIIL